MQKTLKTHASLRRVTQNVGFTMAEILLSLTIIGVVAAITLPSLMANINERTWNTQRKALYARMNQAIAMMPQVGGYGKVTEVDGSITEDTAAEMFLTEGLSKVLKINNICDSEHLADCGVPSSYTNMAGSTISWPKKVSEWNEQFVNFSFVGSYWNDDGTHQYYSYSQPDTKAAAFETQNGESIALLYNPNCIDNPGDVWQYVQPLMCANFVYDLNGNKGPNQVGKDIGFVTALYNTNPSIVSPLPLATDATNGAKMVLEQAGAACVTQDSASRVPNIDELMSMYFNKGLINMPSTEKYWSSSLISNGGAWHLLFYMGVRYTHSRTNTHFVRCVKR